jgi:hypothetical protein
MSNGVKAKLRWLTAAEGGRQAPPPGPEYSTVARFEVFKDRWPDEAWSVVVSLDATVPTQAVVEARVRMLVPDAPSDLLAPGSRFDLFEGSRRVAEGEVLRSTGTST